MLNMNGAIIAYNDRMRPSRKFSCEWHRHSHRIRVYLVRFRVLFEGPYLMTFDEATFKQHAESYKINPDTVRVAVKKINEKANELLNDKAEVKKLIGYIDLTTLGADDTRKKVESVVEKALLPLPQEPSLRCAAVCVYPARVADVKGYITSFLREDKHCLSGDWFSIGSISPRVTCSGDQTCDRGWS
uniref:Deoxyribose-phosphate aldolase n=1 Tax=Ascaris suum TaxID=6253 RepID=F1L640_ASCSU